MDVSPDGEEPEGPSRRVSLVGDSSPQLSRETQSLLRARLRMASLVIFAGFVLFWGWSLFNLDLAVPRNQWVFRHPYGCRSGAWSMRIAALPSW